MPDNNEVHHRVLIIYTMQNKFSHYKRSVLITCLLRIIRNFILLKKKSKIIFFSNLGQLGIKTVNGFKNDKVNKHIPILDIAKNKSAHISGIAEFRSEKSAM